MKEVQHGELNALVELDTKDEISIIGSNFNRMMQTINTLVEEVRHQNEMNSVAVNKQKEAEIRALEAQINPHFLYNTLDCINWMAIKKKEYDISRMLKSLAQILRYSINKSTEIVEITEEFEWMEQYMFLQQYRFNHSFEYSINIEQGLTSLKIHKLLIQPIIENSIIHGLSGLHAGGFISIHIKRDKDRFIIISVQDNGNGINREELEQLNRTLDITSRKEMNLRTDNGIGIQNVIDRARMYYGEEAKMILKSEISKGTTVELHLPLIGYKEDKNENSNSGG